MNPPTRACFPLLAAAAMALCAGHAAAAPSAAAAGIDELQRNGDISRHVWAPEFAALRIGGLQVSPGLALSVRENLRANLGAAVAPALTVHLAKGSTLSLLAANGGVMLVLQSRP